ncbi:uncharacterized protein K452DRAFT_238155 [Aplosporella prunicola CBS 121167]|uniref:Metallo-beta-lactamase domain-containing protein n=1 Tax=Aplosporella prunicola CBS 121167 TaxID=1176127 RepID=A0A6A6AZ47_9PEZI|nr:uncharacterized protein K452DRAFT_238155 [Aplosporella prunicola CBS 121167]KAF2136057.1 hypothetical protein K452DRAFT_238155 [Aplosporella prunicola CBS 121167]
MALRIPFDQGFWQEYLSGQEAKLPALPDVEDVTERVIRIMGGNPGSMQLQGTNTYLVGTGLTRILIDTGEGLPVWIARVIQLLSSRGLSISHVLLTHWHGDHTGGVPSLIAHDPRLATCVYKAQPDSNQHPIADGQEFRVAGATLRAVFTPGHAVDHMVFVLAEEDALFTGDNVLGHGYAVVQDLGPYMGSLRRMQGLGCERAYPAHGATITDLPAKMAEYIHHKEVRVRQVCAALLKRKVELERAGRRGLGGLTLREIVRAIYGHVPNEMADKALVPFLTQVLWMLAEDGVVGFEPGDPINRRWFVKQHAPGAKGYLD